MRQWALVALAVGAPWLSGCRGLANRLLLHPSRDPVVCSAERVDLLRRSDGSRAAWPGEGDLQGGLEGFVAHFGEGELEVVVLGFTGNAGRAEAMVEWSRQLWMEGGLAGASSGEGPRPFAVLTCQYPGFGGSGGDADLGLLAPAAEVAYARARELAGDRPVIVHGLSMGTTCALHLARVLPPSESVGFVLERPPNLWSQVIWQHGWWNLWLLSLPVAWSLPASVCSEDNAAAATGHPALFLVGVSDQTVPPEFSLEVADAYAGPVRVIEVHAGHSGPIHRGLCVRLLEGFRWLDHELRGAAGQPF